MRGNRGSETQKKTRTEMYNFMTFLLIFIAKADLNKI